MFISEHAATAAGGLLEGKSSLVKLRYSSMELVFVDPDLGGFLRLQYTILQDRLVLLGVSGTILCMPKTWW